MAWMTAAVFIPFFGPSLPVLAFGEVMCGIAWGVFQICFIAYTFLLDPGSGGFSMSPTNIQKTLTTAYACKIVPTVLRVYVTSFVCICWGSGILLSSGVIRAVANVDGNMGWRLPFAIQWV